MSSEASIFRLPKRSLCSSKLPASFPYLSSPPVVLLVSTDNVPADAFARCLPARCDRQSESRHDPGQHRRLARKRELLHLRSALAAAAPHAGTRPRAGPPRLASAVDETGQVGSSGLVGRRLERRATRVVGGTATRALLGRVDPRARRALWDRRVLLFHERDAKQRKRQARLLRPQCVRDSDSSQPRSRKLTSGSPLADSCAISPGTTQRYCESPAIRADFLPSLTRISDYLPGLSSVKLPFFSHQTTAIFVSATVLLAASFAVYLPLWTLAYFPRARVLPKPVVRFVRYHARRLFDLAGILVFVSFILHVTIGLGYQLYLIGFRDDFKRWLQFGAYSIGAAKVDWVARLGNGFQLVWVGCACEALLVIAVKVSLHNGLDERVEWPAGGDSKEQY